MKAGRPPMKKLRVAVLGCGRIAAVYKSALEHLDGLCEVVLAMDKHLDRAQAFAAGFAGCEASDAVEPEAFRRKLTECSPDLVHILLPHHLHCTYAVAALECGVNVLTEKPIAITLTDAAITLENGAVYSFFACNYYTMSSPIRVEISCEKGTALLTLEEMEIRWNDGRREVIHPDSAAGTAVGESYWGAFHEIQVRDCYEALLEGRAMPWTPQDAKKTLEIVQAIYLSARVGSDVTL